jgi:acetolactate synthase I/II/III large subunit
MLRWFRSGPEMDYLTPHGGGGMGYGQAGAFGAKLAFPDRPCLGTLGDGGFPMTMNILMNGLQQKVPFTVVIFNNHALGWPIHVVSKEHGWNFEIDDFDYAAIARAMGCKAARPNTVQELHAALLEASTSDVPYVIDARIRIQTDFREATAAIAKLPRKTPFAAGTAE